MQVIVNGEKTNKLSSGECFGELALVSDSCRSATMKCLTDAEMWVLDRKTFQNTLKSLNRLNYNENKAFIDQVSMFDILNEEQKEQVISALV